MSVLIKGMDTPRDCYHCPMQEFGFPNYCKILRSPIDYAGRRSDCPLVEVPTPHGRLIDADEMLSDESEAFMSAQLKLKDEATRLVNEVVHKKIQMLLKDTPTVIDAEEERNDVGLATVKIEEDGHDERRSPDQEA